MNESPPLAAPVAPTFRSTMYSTDRMLVRHFGGEVLDRGPYVVFKTAALPGHFGANFLVYRHGPATDPDDLVAWQQAFDHEFPDQTREPSFYAGWDAPVTDNATLSPLAALGFQPAVWQVYRSESLPAPCIPAGVEVRPLHPDHDATPLLGLMVEGFPNPPSTSLFAHFERQARALLGAVREGPGLCLGAFEGDRLVAHVAVLVGDGLARYQWVLTAPDARQRGICQALLRAAGAWAFATGAQHLVIVAVQGHEPSHRAYLGAGFHPVEALGRLSRRR